MVCRDQSFIERNRPDASTAPRAPVTPRMIDQDAAHRSRGHGQKMDPVTPIHAGDVDQPDVCFVDQRRRIERMAFRLPTQLRVRDAVQLVVDQRKQAIERVRSAVAEFEE